MKYILSRPEVKSCVCYMWSWYKVVTEGNSTRKEIIEHMIFIKENALKLLVIAESLTSCETVNASDMMKPVWPTLTFNLLQVSNVLNL